MQPNLNSHRTLQGQFIGLSMLAAAVLSACGGGSDNSSTSTSTSTPTATPQAVSISFAPTIGNTVLNIGACKDTFVNGVATRGGAAVNTKLTDLRFYISNVKLVKADGTSVAVTLDESIWQANVGSDTVALLDFEDGTCTNNTGGSAATNTKITGNVPAGTYTGVSFTLGVPETLNHTDPTADNTAKPIDSSVPGMGWSWQSGHKHMKVEFSPDSAMAAGTYTGGVQAITAAGAQATTTTNGVVSDVANTSTFVYHLGNTGCVADATATATSGYTCSAVNTVPVTISAFDASKHSVSFDLQALFAGNNGTQNTTGTAAGCMSAADDPECKAMFAALAGAKTGSTVFRAITK